MTDPVVLIEIFFDGPWNYVARQCDEMEQGMRQAIIQTSHLFSPCGNVQLNWQSMVRMIILPTRVDIIRIWLTTSVDVFSEKKRWVRSCERNYAFGSCSGRIIHLFRKVWDRVIDVLKRRLSRLLITTTP